MRFIELKIKDKQITSNKLIEQYLANSEFSWLLECEVDNVKLTIDTDLNIIYWNSGIFYWGDWIWGVFESGEFRSGNWHGGVFLNGIFKGKWIKGVRKDNE